MIVNYSKNGREKQKEISVQTDFRAFCHAIACAPAPLVPRAAPRTPVQGPFNARKPPFSKPQCPYLQKAFLPRLKNARHTRPPPKELC
nr:hypothetical protein [uncultured Ottowia sp.]